MARKERWEGRSVYNAKIIDTTELSRQLIRDLDRRKKHALNTEVRIQNAIVRLRLHCTRRSGMPDSHQAALNNAQYLCVGTLVIPWVKFVLVVPGGLKRVRVEQAANFLVHLNG